MSKHIYRMSRPDPEHFPEDAIGSINNFDQTLWDVYIALCYAERELDGLKSTSLADGRVHSSFVKDLIGLEASVEGMGTTIIATYEKWAKAVKEENRRVSRQRT